MSRVSFFIDGFNVYHSIKGKPENQKLLWLDYRLLAEKFVRQGDTLEKIFYFSAYATWKPHSMKRHRALISALINKGVNVVLGNFKEKDRHCKLCNQIFKIKEEKESDVNIAIHLFREAHEDNFDSAVLLTNDTDLVPAIKMIRIVFPKKRIGVLFPMGRWSTELKNACHFYKFIERRDLEKCQLPDQITLANGIILNRPPEWR